VKACCGLSRHGDGPWATVNSCDMSSLVYQGDHTAVTWTPTAVENDL
jgi:hypothetical protein